MVQIKGKMSFFCLHWPKESNLSYSRQELSGALLERLTSLQLVTSSDDNESTVAGANRPWFELSIYRRGDEALNKLRWMSHENRFMTNDREYERNDHLPLCQTL